MTILKRSRSRKSSAHFIVAPLRAAESLGNAVLKKGAIGQAGKRIVVGEELNAGFGDLALSDVFNGSFVTQDVAIGVVGCANVGHDPAAGTVFAVDLGFGALDDTALLHFPNDGQHFAGVYKSLTPEIA